LIPARHILVFLGFAAVLAAHDIPRDVTVHAFLKPSGNTLQLLVRVPLQSMRDVEFPQRGPGFLDFDRADPLLKDAAQLWIAGAIQLHENGAPLAKQPAITAIHASLDSTKALASFEEALANVRSPQFTNEVNVYWNQVMLDVLFEYPIQSSRSRFSVEPKFARLGQSVLTVLRFIPEPGTVRPYEFRGDPGLIDLDPSWTQSAARFVDLGFTHILEGTDHLLFLLCLVIPFRRFLALIPVVTAFTVAHSLTLIASAYNLGPTALWFPPLIELLIAVSIVFMALENIVRSGNLNHHRWIIAFAFGLVHGFGFSFALRESLQFAGSHLLTSLLAFNAGVELGQILVLALAIPLLNLLFKSFVDARMGIIILSAFVAHTGWHWVQERFTALSQFRFEWPVMNAAFVAWSLRWCAAILMLAGILWWISRYSSHRRHSAASGD
jgi:hypothetical protein